MHPLVKTNQFQAFSPFILKKGFKTLQTKIFAIPSSSFPLHCGFGKHRKKPRSIGDGGNLSSRQRVSELRGSLLRQFVVKVYKTGAVHCVLPHCALDPPHCEQAWEKWEGQVTLVQILVILHTFFGQIVPKSQPFIQFLNMNTYLNYLKMRQSA